MFILNADEPDELAHYLLEKKWMQPEERIISLNKPGEGNMNYVLRITTDLRTFIIKQSRAYVEKYPQIAAPQNRVVTEAAFYTKIESVETVKSFMPELLGLDAENTVLLLEDLGNTRDYSFLYHSDEKLSEDEIRGFVEYLNALHSSFSKVETESELANLEMRQLNSEHIFEYPFMEENGFDLNSIQNGLQEVSLKYKKDSVLKSEVVLLETLYLANGKYLLHGDFYPGSWLQTSSGIKVIDPEFCFYGMREFDLGVLMAHLYLSGQKQSIVDLVSEYYDSYSKLELSVLNGFIGVEIMRRLIGLAQLPLKMDLATKSDLLRFAHQLIVKKKQ